MQTLMNYSIILISLLKHLQPILLHYTTDLVLLLTTITEYKILKFNNLRIEIELSRLDITIFLILIKTNSLLF